MAGFDSPIETQMAAALEQFPSKTVELRREFGMTYESARATAIKELEQLERYGKSMLVYPHVKIGPYEVDFLLLTRNRHRDVVAIVVECDGHEFHEKTKEQAATDKRRDRYLALHSILVLRFAGSEVWADANECAQETLRTAECYRSGPRSTIWLGYLSEDEQQARMEDDYRKVMEKELQKYREQERRLEMRRYKEALELEQSEGYYP